MEPRQPGTATRGQAIKVGRYELATEIFRSEVDTLWSGRITGVDDETPVLVRRIAKRPPVSEQAFEAITEAAFAVVDVHHPRIAAVTDVVVTASEVAVISEHAPGKILLRLQQTAKLKQAPLPIAAALRIAIDLLDGLTAANPLLLEAEVPAAQVYGGLTPDFVWVTSDGEALLLDLSVALAIAADPKLARLPHFLAYRSPEKLAGTADARADVFAVGVMLWELLANRSQIPNTGRPDPRKPPRPLVGLDSVTRSDGAVIFKELADLVARAVDMDPAKRFASPQEMTDAIHALGPDRIAGMADVKAAVDRLSQPGATMKSPRPPTAPRAPAPPAVVAAAAAEKPAGARLPPPPKPPAKPPLPPLAPPPAPGPVADRPAAGAPLPPQAPQAAPDEPVPTSAITALFEDLVLPAEPSADQAPSISEVPRFESGPVAELLSSPSMKAYKPPDRPAAKTARPRRTMLWIAIAAVAAIAVGALGFVFMTQETPGAKPGTSSRNPFARFQLFRGANVDAGPGDGGAAADAAAPDSTERSPAGTHPLRPAPAPAESEPGGHEKAPPKKKPFMPTAI